MDREIIADKLTGIYLHGSMARCFNPKKVILITCSD